MQNNHIGIIGGGQLGMLLVQSAIAFPVFVSVYDPSVDCPASHFTNNFVQGGFDDVEAIVKFGENCDIIIFETESVSLEALQKLQEMGKKVFSDPKDLAWIQDKYIQREKLAEKGFKVPEFWKLEGKEVRNYQGDFPVVQKWRSGGYDGLGVAILESEADLKEAYEVDSVFEQKVDIKMEVSVLVARDGEGNVAVYEPSEMIFDPEANLVDYLVSPARLPKEQLENLKELGKDVAQKFNFKGVYAIEIFIDQDDEVYINEVSPRTHNSGHHTVSANLTSQYEQQIRIALGLPLGSVEQISPCVLINLLGANAEGKTCYKGLEEAYDIDNVQYTIYGKSKVRPKRKMGHALIVEKDLDKAISKVQEIRKTLTITNYE